MTALRDSRVVRLLPLLLVAPLLSSCSRAPSVEVLGSFFPAWLVCFLVSIVLTALVRLVLLRLRVKAALPLLVYPSLAALFTFLLWLIFFY
ncbi:MAG TPA: YtcA family lipoprotein [Candidatus Polarisedimenticolia bacterium]|nr:YtcA family lipoprotein [Candidatus Polarisedimenticolia bacterium]